MKAPIGLLPVLMADGCTTRWLMERTGESREECVRLLSSLGAKRSNARWHLPSIARTERRDRALCADHSGQGKNSGDGRPWQVGRRP